MDQVRWNRIEALLQDALDLHTDERLPFLRRACAGDEELLVELHSLLLNEAAGMALETPAIASVAGHLSGFPGLEQRISHYRIEAHVGAGGMGDVYRARDEDLQRTVALKALPPEFASDSARVRRFEQEAFAASRLNHPNILTIFEIVRSEEGHFIATEFVEGATLRDLMKDPATGSARVLTVERSLDMATQIAAAIKAAHTAWIIHRDIKPENIMVRSDGLVKVLDFGIAKLHDDPDLPSFETPLVHPSEATSPGAVLGTANYMSPEQARGEPLDGRTDLYSLGLVLHEMVSGSRPVAGSPPTIDRVPRSLQRIVRRLLQPKREDRYPSATELLDDLGRARRHLESRTARRMVGLGALALVSAFAIAVVAAALSVHETWDERVLRDGHSAAARQAAFSPDGRLLASCGEDGKVIVWDFAGRKRLVTLPQAAHKIAFSPDGRWLAAGGTDGAISIWNTADWKQERMLRAHRAEISALAFSGDGKLLASSSAYSDNRAIVWDARSWQKKQEWPLGVTHGTFLFLPGEILLTSHRLDSVDLARGELTEGKKDVTVNWMAMSPAGDRLAVIESTGNVVLYRLKGESFSDREVIASRRAHADHGRSAAFSADGRFLATAAENIQIWDAANFKRIGRFDHPSAVWSVAFSPDGRWLVSAHGDGAILIWDLAEWRLEANLNEHSQAVRAVAFHPDGHLAASAGDDRTVTTWDLALARKRAVLTEHETRVTALAFSTNGRTIASVDLDGLVIIHPSDERERPVIRRFQTGWANYALALSPDGRLVANSTGFHDLEGRPRLRYSTGTFGAIYGLDFSDDGGLIAAVTDGGVLSIWDARTLRLLDQVKAGDHPQISVSFSPDGRLVTGDDSGAVRLWSARPLREIAVVGRHAARVKSVAFSPDGETIASAGDDKMIALWDAGARKLRTRIGTHASPVYAVAFSADGNRIISGEHDHSVRLYTRRRELWGMALE